MPAEGWGFAGWSGDAGSTVGSATSAVLVMDRDREVTATFKPWRALVTTNLGSGSITRSISGSQYLEGAKVTVTAKADMGWRFIQWEGSLTNSNPTIEVTLDAAKD